MLLEARGREGLLELDDYALRAAVSLPAETLPGERIEAELIRVAPWEGTVRFALRG